MAAAVGGIGGAFVGADEDVDEVGGFDVVAVVVALGGGCGQEGECEGAGGGAQGVGHGWLLSGLGFCGNYRRGRRDAGLPGF